MAATANTVVEGSAMEFAFTDENLPKIISKEGEPKEEYSSLMGKPQSMSSSWLSAWGLAHLVGVYSEFNIHFHSIATAPIIMVKARRLAERTRYTVLNLAILVLTTGNALACILVLLVVSSWEVNWYWTIRAKGYLLYNKSILLQRRLPVESSVELRALVTWLLFLLHSFSDSEFFKEKKNIWRFKGWVPNSNQQNKDPRDMEYLIVLICRHVILEVTLFYNSAKEYTARVAISLNTLKIQPSRKEGCSHNKTTENSPRLLPPGSIKPIYHVTYVSSWRPLHDNEKTGNRKAIIYASQINSQDSGLTILTCNIRFEFD